MKQFILLCAGNILIWLIVIRTFVKFIGGNIHTCNEIAEYFINAKVATIVCKDANTTELGKIVSTTQYGWDIIQMKEIYRLCAQYNVPFSEVYTLFNETYNKGYEAMDMGQYKRSILKYMPGEIGGHCVVNNSTLLDDIFTQMVKDFNGIYENEESEV